MLTAARLQSSDERTRLSGELCMCDRGAAAHELIFAGARPLGRREQHFVRQFNNNWVSLLYTSNCDGRYVRAMELPNPSCNAKKVIKVWLIYLQEVFLPQVFLRVRRSAPR